MLRSSASAEPRSTHDRHPVHTRHPDESSAPARSGFRGPGNAASIAISLHQNEPSSMDSGFRWKDGGSCLATTAHDAPTLRTRGQNWRCLFRGSLRSHLKMRPEGQTLKKRPVTGSQDEATGGPHPRPCLANLRPHAEELRVSGASKHARPPPRPHPSHRRKLGPGSIGVQATRLPLRYRCTKMNRHRWIPASAGRTVEVASRRRPTTPSC